MKDVSINLGKLGASMYHLHDGLECILVIRGCITIETEAGISILKADDLVVFPAQKIHTVGRCEDNVVLLLSVNRTFLFNEFASLISANFNCNSSMATAEQSAAYFELKRLMVRLFLTYSDKRTAWQLECKALLLRFLHKLVCSFPIAAIRPVAETGDTLQTSPELEQLLTKIHESYFLPLSLKSIANEQKKSLAHVSKWFKDKMGIGFYAYVTKVRLEKALPALLRDNCSVLQIAIDHGFTNAKAFSEAFRKQYGKNPSDYRKQYMLPHQQPPSEAMFDPVEIDTSGGTQALLQYMREHADYSVPVSAVTALEHITLSASSCDAPVQVFTKPELILDIGRLQTALATETVQQLKITKKKLAFTHVYFEDLFGPGFNPLDSNPFFGNYAHYCVFDLFRQLELCPFYHLDYAQLCANTDEGDAKDFCKQFHLQLAQLLHFLLQSFPASSVCRWHIELACSDHTRMHDFFAFYKEVQTVLLPLSHIVQLGLLLPLNFTNDTSLLALQNLKIDFVSLYVYPDSDSEMQQDYHRILLSDVRTWLAKFNLHTRPIFLPRWNTLAGKGLVQTGTFFRSAIIFDTLLQLSSAVSGLGFPLNTYEPSLKSESSEVDTSGLSLFLYFQTRRPVFFVLDSFCRLGSQCLFKNSNCIVSRTLQGEYVIVLYHPCYINPLFSVDAAYINNERRNIELLLRDLPQGRYLCKKFIFDKDSAGVYGRWEKAGFPLFKDPDFVDYMNATAPELLLFIDEVAADYSLKAELTFNGLVLLMVKKIDG